MFDTNTRERIIRKLRKTDKPALSAANLSEELDVSVRTINNHIDDLVDEGKLQTHQIGNATAYYLKETEIPSHDKPNHYCKRCGRDINTLHDFAKIETETYYTRQGREPGTPNFFILCRFCHEDLINWIHNDDASMGSYRGVDHWDIPESQKEGVKNDPEIETEYSETKG